MCSRGSRDAVGVEPNARRRCARPPQRNRVARVGPSVIAAPTFVRPCRGVFVVVTTLRLTCRQQGYEPKRFRIGEENASRLFRCESVLPSGHARSQSVKGCKRGELRDSRAL